MDAKERAAWCIKQAEELEAGHKPRAEYAGPVPIGLAVADFYRESARLLVAEDYIDVADAAF